MADIFVSYARADKTRVAPLVAALEAQGWALWWDPEITPGQEFDSLIRRELSSAKAVIVVWTPTSVDSRWVRGEARLGADRGVLVPVRIDKAELPIDALAIHTTDLDDWKEDPSSAAFQELVKALARLLGPPAARKPQSGPSVSICVLPFANMSDDREQEYFSDGITEDIITDLSKVSALHVISRNSAFTFKGRHVDLPQVAKQLNVTHVLEGSVRKSGNRVRITAQLIDGATNGHVWADRYDRNLDDIFALQDEISEAIVKALKLKLFPEEKKAIGDRGTTSVEAYDLYLKGQAATRDNSREAFARARTYYRQALALDPQFLAAWIGLATGSLGLAAFAPEHAAGAGADMASAIERSLSLAPNEAEGLMLQARKAVLIDRDRAAAGRILVELIALVAPATLDKQGMGFDQLGYGQLLANFGHNKLAIEVFKAMAASDPLSLQVSAQLQYNLDAARRHDEAEAEYQRTRDFPGDHSPWEFQRVTRLWVQGAPAALARAQYERAVEGSSGFFPLHRELLAVLDNPQESLALLRRAYGEPFYRIPLRLNILAMIVAHYGDVDFTLDILRQAFVDMRGALTVNLWHSLYAEARKDPRFKDILRGAGLVQSWRETGKWGDFARPLGDDDFEIIR